MVFISDLANRAVSELRWISVSSCGSNPGHFRNPRYFLHCTGTYWKV